MTNFAGPAMGAPVRFRSDAFAGVRTRRILAIGLDLILVAIVAAVLWLILVIGTFGLALFMLPPIFPLVAFFYNGLTVSGWRMATPGMRAMDLEMRMHESGARVPFINAAAHALFFWLSLAFPPIFLITLVAEDKRMLHDILAGVVVLRRL